MLYLAIVFYIICFAQMSLNSSIEWRTKKMEILEYFKKDIDSLGFKCYFTKSYLYLMGGKALNLCTSDEIVVLLKKYKFQVIGENLTMDELSKGEIRISGRIKSINIL